MYYRDPLLHCTFDLSIQYAYSILIVDMEVGGDEFSDWILELGVHIHDERLKAVFSKVKLCLSKIFVGIMSHVGIMRL